MASKTPKRPRNRQERMVRLPKRKDSASPKRRPPKLLRTRLKKVKPRTKSQESLARESLRLRRRAKKPIKRPRRLKRLLLRRKTARKTKRKKSTDQTSLLSTLPMSASATS